MNTYNVRESSGAIKASVTDEFRRENPQMFAGQMPKAMKVATQVLETHEIVRRLRQLVELTIIELDV